MFYSFDDYWKKIGKFYPEVIENPLELENDFYTLAKKIRKDAEGADDETYDFAHIEGYECCEKENNLIPKKDK